MTAAATLIHIVDEDPNAQEATAQTLQAHRFLTRAWSSTAEFLRDCDSVTPGCIVIDPFHGNLDAAAIHHRLTDPAVGLPAVILTSTANVDAAVCAMRAGAIDFLRKPANDARLIAALEVAQGRLTEAQRHAATKRHVQTLMEQLSPRERQVLDGLARGCSNKEIARNLSISSRTVEIHRASLMDKLNAESLSQVLRIAFMAELCHNSVPALQIA